MAIKTFNDGGRFLLVIEPVGDEELKIIKEIKKICGLENEEPKTIENVLPPSIPKAETAPATPVNSKVGPGYQKYLETILKLKRKELTGEEKEKAKESVKKMAEILKTKIPKGENLRFCIENMSDMFSERIETAVLEKMHISRDQLILADEKIMTEAYKLAVTV